MTETVADVGSLDKTIKRTVSPSELERAAIRELVVAARARGEDLTGPDELLKLLTRTVLETALEEELTEHLGYDKHAAEGRTGGTPGTGSGPRRW
jgi:putative transposase